MPQNASDHNDHAHINPKSSPMSPYCKMIKEDWDHGALKCVHNTKVMSYLCFMIASLQKRCNQIKPHHRNSNWQHLSLASWINPFHMQNIPTHFINWYMNRPPMGGQRQLFNARLPISDKDYRTNTYNETGLKISCYPANPSQLQW